jgi:hypothetical protein
MAQCGRMESCHRHLWRLQQGRHHLRKLHLNPTCQPRIFAPPGQRVC